MKTSDKLLIATVGDRITLPVATIVGGSYASNEGRNISSPGPRCPIVGEYSFFICTIYFVHSFFLLLTYSIGDIKKYIINKILNSF